jgi:raffinose/stachyose/melibiose transport system permease protein
MLDIRSRVGKVAIQVALTVAIVPFAFPLVVMLAGSFGGQGAVVNYTAVVSRPEFVGFFLNSARIAIGVVLITYVCTMLAAYALAKLRLRFREAVFYFLVAALTLPSAALSVPLFITIRQLGLYDSPWAVILPLAALQTAFNILLARGFIEGIPDELLDAARIDGAGTFRILLHIVMPIARPITAVIVVWSFVAAWNEYLLPLLFLQRVDQQTITLLPNYFQSQFASDQTKIFAASVLIALPTIICYVAFQKFFERGLTAGAVK